MLWDQPTTDSNSPTEGMVADAPAGSNTWTDSPVYSNGAPTSSDLDIPFGAENAPGDLVVEWNASSHVNNPAEQASVRPAGGSFDSPSQLQTGGSLVIDNSGSATVIGNSESQTSSPLRANENTVTVTNPGNQSGNTATSVNLQIVASASDGGTLTYSATDLPAGLSINSSTGVISGTPSEPETAQVTVTAAEASGTSGSTSFSWTITAGSNSGGSNNSGSNNSGSNNSGGSNTTSGTSTTTTTSTNSGSGSGTTPTGGSTGTPLPALGASPGAPQPKTCSYTGTMPRVLESEQEPAISQLVAKGVPMGNITTIERRPSQAPVKKVGEIYSQVPKSGAEINPCTVHVRLVVYAGPDGLSVKDFKLIQSLDGSPLNSTQLPGWDLTYQFRPANVDVPTVAKGGVQLLSAKKHQLLLKVLMPERQDVYYTATMGHGGPGVFINPNIPAPGTDGALGVGFENLWGESVWTDAPVAAHIVLDTDEVDGSSDNQTYDAETTQHNGPDGPVSVLTNEAHFNITPSSRGHICAVAFAPCKVGPCAPIAMDSIPVVKRPGDFDSVLGFKYTADGREHGVVLGTNAKAEGELSHERPALSLGDIWNALVSFFTGGAGSEGTSTVTLGNPATAPSLVYFDGGSLSNVGPAAAGTSLSRLVYDFSNGLYPLIDKDAIGLPAGQVYEMKDGQAVNLLDGSKHNVIAAGSGNVQNGEVLGVIAAGAHNVIAAGAHNVVPGNGFLDGDAYGLTPGLYQISRDGSGAVTATPGNVIAAGSGNVIAAGAGNFTGYQAMAAALPLASVAAGPTLSMMKNGVLVGNDLTSTGNWLSSGTSYDIPSLEDPSMAIHPSGQVIAAGSGNLLGNQANLSNLDPTKLAAAAEDSVIGAGAGNLGNAGAGNVIGAGAGNVIAAGAHN